MEQPGWWLNAEVDEGFGQNSDDATSLPDMYCADSDSNMAAGRRDRIRGKNTIFCPGIFVNYEH